MPGLRFGTQSARHIHGESPLAVALGGNEPEIVQKLLKMNEDDISDVLKSQKGYHIFKVTGITAEKKKTFEECKDLVDNKLRLEKENSVRNEFIDKLMKAEQVFIFEGEFKTSQTPAAGGAGAASAAAEKEQKENKNDKK